MKRRHWKQHWDPTAPLVFTRRMALNLGGVSVVQPGDDLTPEIRAAIGRTEAHQRARLRRWWNAGFLAIKNWKPAKEIAQQRTEPPRMEMQDLGKGWYNIYGAEPGVVVVKVRGRAAAQAALDKLREPATVD